MSAEETDRSHLATQPAGLSTLSLPSRFAQVQEIGSGGMGTVYSAQDTELDRKVAIKVLHNSLQVTPEARQRFFQEAKILSSLQHANIVSLMSFGSTDSGDLYHVMELLEGESLADRLKQGALSMRDFKWICMDILNGLEFAASKGVTHRDMKPSNVFLCKTAGQPDCAKIFDFGIARPEGGTNLTEKSIIMGSPLYMSPEQCQGKIAGERSDLYSVGCLLFECLAGRPPFVGETAMETMVMHTTHSVPALVVKGDSGDTTGNLVQLVLQCLSKEPSDRPGSFSKLKQEMSKILSSVRDDQSSQIAASEKFNREDSHKLIGILLVTLGLVLIVGLVFSVKSKKMSAKNKAELAKVMRAAPTPMAPGNSADANTNMALRRFADDRERLMRQWKRPISPLERQELSLKLSEIYRQSGDLYRSAALFEQSQADFDSALTYAKTCPVPERQRARVLAAKGFTSACAGLLPMAKLQLEDALLIAAKQQDPDLLIVSHEALGYTAALGGDWSEALKQFSEAKAIWRTGVSLISGGQVIGYIVMTTTGIDRGCPPPKKKEDLYKLAKIYLIQTNLLLEMKSDENVAVLLPLVESTFKKAGIDSSSQGGKELCGEYQQTLRLYEEKSGSPKGW